MELTCRHCSELIPTSHYDWERLAAECPNCKNWSGFNQPTRDAIDHTAEVYHTNQLYIDFIRKLTITRNPEGVKIEMPSHKYQTTDEKQAHVFGQWMSAVLIVIAVVLGTAVEMSRFSEWILVLLFAVPGLLLGFFVSQNSGTFVISLDKESVSTHIRLLRGFQVRWRSTEISAFKQFYVKRRSTHRVNTKFDLCGIDAEGGHKQIIDGNESLMLLAESELERLLKIEDATVAGSVTNPFHKTISADAIPPWVTNVRIRERGVATPNQGNVNIVLDQVQLDEKNG